ncbi:MAG: hypothetical protein U0414_22445 [Polyangiaceae bacterium]
MRRTDLDAYIASHGGAEPVVAEVPEVPTVDTTDDVLSAAIAVARRARRE